jgi:predicted amidohydrolase YtcJ
LPKRLRPGHKLRRRFRAGNALADTGAADVVFVNGKVYTVNLAQPWAQAVAVRGQRIAYVGDTAGAKALVGSRTEVVDLNGRMLIPGFVEAHTHPFVGSALSQGVDLQYDTREKLLEVLRAYAKTNPSGRLVRGFGWRYIAFPPTGPRKEDLDTIWPDKPVFLCAIDIHCAWVNSKALQLAGITKDTPDPVPNFSRFERDASTGEPTGFLIEPPAMVKVLAITSKRWGTRAANLFRYKSLLLNKARLALGTDWPSASYYSTYKPLDAVEVALTRKEIRKPDAEPLSPTGERLELAQALRANTLDAAYQLRLEDVTGSIEVGKFADLAILQENLFNVPVREIHATPVVMTMMNGRFTHRTGSA